MSGWLIQTYTFISLTRKVKEESRVSLVHHLNKFFIVYVSVSTNGLDDLVLEYLRKIHEAIALEHVGTMINVTSRQDITNLKKINKWNRQDNMFKYTSFSQNAGKFKALLIELIKT